MADEIKLNVSLQVTNGNFRWSKATGTVNVDQTTAFGGGPGTVNIGTSEEDISFGDITTLGYVFLQNLDATNYVQYGPKSGTMVTLGRLKAGEIALLRLEPGITLTMKANTAACNVLIAAFDD